ncbi:MAG: hypothetical protein ACI4C3_05590 [Bacteroides sp.]
MRKITEEQYRFAQSRVEELLFAVDDSTPLSDPKAVELKLMADIVADYEKEHYPVSTTSVSVVNMLRSASL